jgi:hypothetical protein
MATDSTCSYIHLEVKESSLKDLYNTKFKERFYAKKKNLQSIKIKVKERELRAYEYLSPKMYEHVGMADNHHRRRSDERQIAPYHKRTKNDEKTVIKDHKA